MSHFARVRDGVVQEVIVAEQDFIDNFISNEPGAWIQCSYNTKGNVHLLGGTPLRKNYPSPDWLYDGTGFYPPKPFTSWVLNETTYLWDPPKTYPTDGKQYVWDESKTDWKETEGTP